VHKHLIQNARISTLRTQYRTSDVAKNLGRYLSFTERIVQRKDFELILTVKMETRHPEGGNLEVNFQRSVIIAEL